MACFLCLFSRHLVEASSLASCFTCLLTLVNRQGPLDTRAFERIQILVVAPYRQSVMLGSGFSEDGNHSPMVPDWPNTLVKL